MNEIEEMTIDERREWTRRYLIRWAKFLSLLAISKETGVSRSAIEFFVKGQVIRKGICRYNMTPPEVNKLYEFIMRLREDR